MICGADHRSFGWELTDHFSSFTNLVQALPTKEKRDIQKKKTNTFLEQALKKKLGQQALSQVGGRSSFSCLVG
jgi:ABC-type uncharacterized transport system YnjBCD ATPase subunit